MANEKWLIDAEAVRHKINAFAASVVYRGNAEMFNGKDTCNPHEYTRGYERGILDAQKIVCGQDPVDAVEVVRCKDCQMWKCHGMPFDITKGTCHNPIFHFHHGHVIDECFMPVTNETDFCSCGERREGE